ncbi:MAG: hypothetical protein NWE84_02605 [Candidatus Bathyarchaeota archaeon]|nr:hypothetical protein [Candidatus Bathyarchaeota archaeon]
MVDGRVKIGLFLVVLSWFSYTLYRFSSSITTQIIFFTDVPGTIGLGFRTAAGFIAAITIIFYLVGRDLSTPEATMSLRWVVIFEAIGFLCFFPSAIWGFEATFPGYPREIIIISTGLPCLVEAILIPVVLAKVFLELNPNKSARGGIKWALISGVAYLFVFWFNYSMQWTATLMQKGTNFVVLHPINAFGFALTAVGLLLLTLFAALSFRRMFGKESLTGLDLKRVGSIITVFGLYFDLIFLLWILFGYVGGYNLWHTFFVHHNVDLWCLTLPLVGLPFIFQARNKKS